MLRLSSLTSSRVVNRDKPVDDEWWVKIYLLTGDLLWFIYDYLDDYLDTIEDIKSIVILPNLLITLFQPTFTSLQG